MYPGGPRQGDNGEGRKAPPLLGTLRTVSPQATGEHLAGEEEELRVHRIAKEGRRLVNLRYVRGADEWLVEAQVYPAGTAQIEPIPAGPYAFTSARQAELFLDELALALEYLGCDVL